MAERRVAEFVVEYLPEALADAHPYLKMHHQRGIVAGIAAGAAEIQLNIIANDVLKLAEGAALMDLSLNPDQIAILDALDSLAKPYAEVPIGDHGFALTDAEALDRELAEGGFLDVGVRSRSGCGDCGGDRRAAGAAAVQATEAALARWCGRCWARACGAASAWSRKASAGRLLRFLREGATVVVVGDTVSPASPPPPTRSAPNQRRCTAIRWRLCWRYRPTART